MEQKGFFVACESCGSGDYKIITNATKPCDCKGAIHTGVKDNHKVTITGKQNLVIICKNCARVSEANVSSVNWGVEGKTFKQVLEAKYSVKI